MSKEQTPTPRYKVGTEVIIIANNSEHGFNIGEKIKIDFVEKHNTGYGMPYLSGRYWLCDADIQPISLPENELLTEADNKLKYLEEGLAIIRKDFEALDKKIQEYISDIKNGR